MGNISSTPGALATHTPTPGTHALSETRPSFSIPPFEPSTFVTKTSSHSSHSSHGGLSPTRTGEYCSWDWERDTTSCSSWVYTVDVPTPFTLPTPPGGYGTSESSLGFPYYTCTDFLCIDSVVSKYGFSLCFPTATPPFGLPTETETETWRSTEDPTPYAVPTTTSACDPVFDWENCPGPTSEPLYSITDTWTWPTDEPPETSSDCDSSVAPAPTEDCDFGVECYTSVRFTIPEGPYTPSATVTKHSYSYRSGSTRRTSRSSTSDCDYTDSDLIPTATAKHTTWEWGPDPWSEHTVSTTLRFPRHTSEAKK